MANVIRYVTALQNTRLNAIKSAIDAGGGGTGKGRIKVYGGTKPVTVNTAISGQTLLADLQISANPCSAGASSGVLTLVAVSDDTSADASGTATFALITDSDGGVVCDVDVTDTNGAGPMKLNTTNIVAGGTVSVTSVEITAGNS